MEKTTFLNHISQLYEIPAKTIFSDREDILEKKLLAKFVSYMPQENHLINGTILENIALGVEKDKLKKNLKTL